MPTPPVSATGPSAAGMLSGANDSEVEILNVSPQPASLQAPSVAGPLTTANDSDVEIVEVSLIQVVLLSLEGDHVTKFIQHKDNGCMKPKFLCRKFKLPPAQGLYYQFGPNDDQNGMWVMVRERA
jgi:hypothetical protein